MTYRFTWRAEMKAVGAHFEHQAGIAYRTLKRPLPDGCDKVPPMLTQNLACVEHCLHLALNRYVVCCNLKNM